MSETYIGVLLDRAAEQYKEDGVVDVALQSELAEEGYLLRSLQRDIDRILELADR